MHNPDLQGGGDCLELPKEGGYIMMQNSELKLNNTRVVGDSLGVISLKVFWLCV